MSNFVVTIQAMKRSFILLPFILLLLSCNNVEDTEFAIPYSEELELPATFGIEYPVSTELISISTESDDRFLENETTASLLNSARISTAQITISGSTGDDFEFVDQITIFLSADGLDEIEVASIDGADVGDVLLQADLKVIDVKEYLKLPTIQFRLEYTSDGFSNQNRDCVLNVRFTVDATKA